MPLAIPTTPLLPQAQRYHAAGLWREAEAVCRHLLERDPRDADGWFYKTQKDIFDETALTRTEQETARKKLRGCRVLESAELLRTDRR